MNLSSDDVSGEDLMCGLKQIIQLHWPLVS